MFRIVDHNDPRFPGHVCIECVEDDGRVSSRSWAPADVDPAVRVTEVAALVDDRTTTDTTEIPVRVPTVDEYRALCGIKRRDYADPDPGECGKDHHRVIATYLAVKEFVTVDEAAAAVEVDKAALVAEAEAWAVAAEVKVR